jgi:hypothetical protein
VCDTCLCGGCIVRLESLGVRVAKCLCIAGGIRGPVFTGGLAERKEWRVRVDGLAVFEKHVACCADVLGLEVSCWVCGLVHCKETVDVAGFVVSGDV